MNTELIISLLKRALAEEFAAHYAYFVSRPFLKGKEFVNLSKFANEFAQDELYDHANKLMDRLSQLDACPCDMSIYSDLMTHTTAVQPAATNSTFDFLRLNIEAEETAIKTYNEIILIARAEEDFATEKIVKEILLDEEEHLDTLKNFVPSFEEEFTASAASLVENRDKLSEEAEAARASAESLVEKAKKGSSAYDEWLRKYQEKRSKISKESMDSLDEVRNILSRDGSYEKKLGNKTLKVSDDGEKYTVEFGNDKSTFDSSLGVVTRKMEDKILSIFESNKTK